MLKFEFIPYYTKLIERCIHCNIEIQSCKALLFISEMNHIPRLSEAVYTGMCAEVGLPTEVQIRREVDDIKEVLHKSISLDRHTHRMKSGSDREGFRFESSDIDHMSWFLDHKLICDLSQIHLYRVPQHTVILMEWEDLPPGFTRLKMITPSFNLAVMEAYITIDKEPTFLVPV